MASLFLADWGGYGRQRPKILARNEHLFNQRYFELNRDCEDWKGWNKLVKSPPKDSRQRVTQEAISWLVVGISKEVCTCGG